MRHLKKSEQNFNRIFSLCSEYDQPIKIRDINDLGPVFSNFPDSVCQSPEDGIVIDNVSTTFFISSRNLAYF